MNVLGIDPGKTVGLALLQMGAHTAVPVFIGTCDEDGAGDLERFAKLQPDLVAIERVEHVHGSERMGSSYAEGLALGNWIGGLLAGLARVSRVRVVTVDAATWRSAIVGSRSPSDGEVARAIKLRVPAWPKVSNAHQRDAAGVALWAGLRPAGSW